MTDKEKEKYMLVAIKEAIKAKEKDEVPVGAVIIKENKIIAKAHNTKEMDKSVLSHAELSAIKKASKKLDTWHLDDATMFVTLEPCLMCIGAILNSRIKALYFGAYDKRYPCCSGDRNILESIKTNHKISVVEGGILEKECSTLLTEYFKEKR